MFQVQLYFLVISKISLDPFMLLSRSSRNTSGCFLLFSRCRMSFLLFFQNLVRRFMYFFRFGGHVSLPSIRVCEFTEMREGSNSCCK